MESDVRRCRQYAMELVLIGAMLTRNGDSERLIALLDADLLDNLGPRKGMRAIQQRDLDTMKDFLAIIGVTLQKDEKAVDAILRTFLTNRKTHLSQLLKTVDEGIEQENKRAEKSLESAPAS